MAWNDLTLSDKARMIQMAVRSGITDLRVIHDVYNKYADGGKLESSPEISAQASIERANQVYNNYEDAVDSSMSGIDILQHKIRRYLKDNIYDKIPAGISNCTLTATQWIDPSQPINSASSIVRNPSKYNYSPVNMKDMEKGDLLITKKPNEDIYHTMLVTDFAKEDGVYNFNGELYPYKKGEPLLNYSTGGSNNSSLRVGVPLSIYTINSGGYTENHPYRYNYKKGKSVK